jgi:hypothetical protein
VIFWRLNVANSYLKVLIHIFGYGKLKRALRAFICTMDYLHRGVGKPHWRLTEERSMTCDDVVDDESSRKAIDSR